jgi:hypothetical protein
VGDDPAAWADETCAQTVKRLAEIG